MNSNLNLSIVTKSLKEEKMAIGTKIIEALKKKYEASILENLATIEIYLQNPVGIGEHSGIIEEIDGLLEAVACAQDKLNALNSHLNNR